MQKKNAPPVAAEPEGKREFLDALANGLQLMEAFNEEMRSVTIQSAAELLGVTRPASRRILLTLVELGYMQQNDRQFSLAPPAASNWDTAISAPWGWPVPCAPTCAGSRASWAWARPWGSCPMPTCCSSSGWRPTARSSSTCVRATACPPTRTRSDGCCSPSSRRTSWPRICRREQCTSSRSAPSRNARSSARNSSASASAAGAS